MADKIPTEISIDMELLADLVVQKLQEGIVGAMQDDLIAFGVQLGVLEAAQAAMATGTDGLRVALQEWANEVPPK